MLRYPRTHRRCRRRRHERRLHPLRALVWRSRLEGRDSETGFSSCRKGNRLDRGPCHGGRDGGDLLGADPVFVSMTRDLRPDIDRLEHAVTDRTRLLIINNPVNPTGVVFSESEIKAIGEIAAARDLLVLADEIYDELVYSGGFSSCLGIAELADRLLYVNGFSKTYAMTGWRLGYLVAPRHLLEHAHTIHSNCAAAVSWPAQRAGIAALQGPVEPIAEMVAGYRARRNALLQGLAGTPGLRPIVPEGEGHLRLSFSATFDDIRIGVERLHRVFERLSG